MEALVPYTRPGVLVVDGRTTYRTARTLRMCYSGWWASGTFIGDR